MILFPDLLRSFEAPAPAGAFCNEFVTLKILNTCYSKDTRKGINLKERKAMFNEFGKGKKIEWKYDSSDNEWTSLDTWVAQDCSKEFIVKGVFINPHGKISKTETGAVPYIITEGYNIRLPLWCVKMVNALLDNDDYIKGINNGECGARVIQYEDDYGHTRNKIELYDI